MNIATKSKRHKHEKMKKSISGGVLEQLKKNYPDNNGTINRVNDFLE